MLDVLNWVRSSEEMQGRESTLTAYKGYRGYAWVGPWDISYYFVSWLQ